MHVSPAKHSDVWLPRKCDYQREKDRYIHTKTHTLLLCFAWNTKKNIIASQGNATIYIIYIISLQASHNFLWWYIQVGVTKLPFITKLYFFFYEMHYILTNCRHWHFCVQQFCMILQLSTDCKKNPHTEIKLKLLWEMNKHNKLFSAKIPHLTIIILPVFDTLFKWVHFIIGWLHLSLHLTNTHN